MTLSFPASRSSERAPARYFDFTQGTPHFYKGGDGAGYGAFREARIQRMKPLGISPQDFKPSPVDEVTMTRFGQPGVLTNPSWSALTAAQQIGRASCGERVGQYV